MLNDITTPPLEPNDDPTAAPRPVVARELPTHPAPTPGLAVTGVPHVGVEDVGPTRPGAHRPPPTEPGVRPHEGIRPHGDRMEPGIHTARVMGDRSPTDAIYDMPMEDRASPFSLGLTIVVFAVVTLALLYVLFSVFR